jgi:hypothetical protein
MERWRITDLIGLSDLRRKWNGGSSAQRGGIEWPYSRPCSGYRWESRRWKILWSRFVVLLKGDDVNRRGYDCRGWLSGFIVITLWSYRMSLPGSSEFDVGPGFIVSVIWGAAVPGRNSQYWQVLRWGVGGTGFLPAFANHRLVYSARFGGLDSFDSFPENLFSWFVLETDSFGGLWESSSVLETAGAGLIMWEGVGGIPFGGFIFRWPGLADSCCCFEDSRLETGSFGGLLELSVLNRNGLSVRSGVLV